MERILCAAIWYKDFPLVDDSIPSDLFRPINCDRGIVFSGHRHPHCLLQQVAITGNPQYQAGEEIQGYLTSINRFVDRVEGLVIALDANQVRNLNDVRGNRLHSEDLY